MPRDNDKNNDSRGRRDRPSGGKGRSGAARGPEKKFAKRGFAGKSDGEKRPYTPREGGGEKRPYAGKSGGDRPYAKKPYAGGGKPYAGKRDGDAPRPRGDRPSSGDRPQRFNRDDRPARWREAPLHPARRARRCPAGRALPGQEIRRQAPLHAARGGRREASLYAARRPAAGRPSLQCAPAARWRPAARRPAGAKIRRRQEIFTRRPGPWTAQGFWQPRDRKSGPGDRGESKPWQKRDASSPDHAGRNSRPPRDGARNFDRPRFDKPREDRGGEERPRVAIVRSASGRNSTVPARTVRNSIVRAEGGSSWQEHPRSEAKSFDRTGERPRRDNEDDSKVFAKRPAFGGRGEYRERKPDFEKRAARPPREKKSGERIAKVLSRAGLASRRDAEEWIVQGRVTVNGRIINSPALDVTANDVITVDGKPLPPRERTRLFMFHKPRGLMTTHADPEGRPTVFDNLPEGLPRLISIGRLDFNTEGLLLLTNDGGLARALELPDTGWLRRYRVRAHGEVTQGQLDELKKGVEVDGVKYGPIDATLERDQGANVWLVFAIREGKNREVRNVMAHLGLEVNRLIRISYGPFQLGELAEGQVEEVKTRVLREQLGEKIAELAGADFNRPMPGDARADEDEAPRGKKPFKPAGKSGLIADRKGRRILVQRTGSDEARARNEAEQPQRGYTAAPRQGLPGAVRACGVTPLPSGEVGSHRRCDRVRVKTTVPPHPNPLPMGEGADLHCCEAEYRFDIRICRCASSADG